MEPKFRPLTEETLQQYFASPWSTPYHFSGNALRSVNAMEEVYLGEYPSTIKTYETQIASVVSELSRDVVEEHFTNGAGISYVHDIFPWKTRAISGMGVMDENLPFTNHLFPRIFVLERYRVGEAKQYAIKASCPVQYPASYLRKALQRAEHPKYFLIMDAPVGGWE